MKKRKHSNMEREAYLGAAGMIILLLVLALVIGERVAYEAVHKSADKPSAAVKSQGEPSAVGMETLEAIIPEGGLPATSPEPTEEPEPVSRYADITFSEEEERILACLVYHEARGEPFEGQVAVVEVVFNRMLSPYFPDTVEEVVFQKYYDVWQFSPAPYLYTAEPTAENYNAVWVAYRGLDPKTTIETVYFSGSPYNEHISAIIGGHYFCEID